MDIRKLNIMCFGLKESTEENVDIRNEAEKANLSHIIHDADVLEVSVKDFSVDGSLVRIGTFDENKTRPLRFKARTFESKKKLLETARNKLKNQDDPELKDVFFKPDLTKKAKGRGVCQERK